MFPIPDNWKSPRQRIVEVYIQTRSVPVTAKVLGYVSPSFVRLVVHEYREFLASPLAEAAEV